MGHPPWARAALGRPLRPLGDKGEYPIWNRKWKVVDDAVLTRFITHTYKHTDGTPYVETTPHNPWGN